ncbi:ATP-binding protein [Streptomyces sp. NBC_00269]|uniref:AAA family ATPase n=1 Tax=Streptomyces sp. NBC_00269 TaxID=2975696 RepID=UPI002E29F367|nr:AAA family ATPase [Streptomyces sp. NBC_00269]
MRLEHIKIDNFRGLSQVDIPFSRFGCLIGENNAGKSSVFQALNMFLSSGSAVATDFLHPERAIRIQMTFAEIGDADLQRLQESHRERMRPEIVDGRLTLARIYTVPGKGSTVLVKKVPSDERYHRSALTEVIKPGMSDEEVAEGVRLVYPEIYSSITGKLTRIAVKRAWEETVAALKDDDFKSGDEPLKTGMDKSVAGLPEDFKSSETVVTL